MSGTLWVVYAIAIVLLVGFMMMRRSGQVPVKDAQDYMKRGAMVIDVRSPAEFNSGHLSQAYNMPVDEIEGLVANRIKDKDRFILVHCQTGLRSKKAKDRLERLGYSKVFDMGSYERAFKIVTGKTL